MNRTCPLCSFDNTAAPAMSYSSGTWLIKGCGRCGLVYLENPPGDSVLQDQLAWEKTSPVEYERRRSEEPVLQRLSGFVKYVRHQVFKRDKLSPLVRRYFAPGAVMDVGCGDGKFLQRVGELGFNVNGVEISDVLAKAASARAAKFGGRVVAGNAVDGLDQFTDSMFTSAILISYLEHESNPLPVLVKLHRKLTAGGRIIVKVPNFGCWNRVFRGARWCGLRFPDHVNYFTPRTLREIIQRAGFKIVRFSLKDRFPFSDNMWAVCQSA